MDKYLDKNKEYYERIKEGKATNKDFERYIYGQDKAIRKDERDIQEEKERLELSKLKRSF